MIPDHPKSSREPAAGQAFGDSTLDGEVIPPRIRVVNPDRAPSRDDAAAPVPVRLPWGTMLLAGALIASISGAGALEAYRWHLHSSRVAAGPSPTVVALARLGKDVGDLKAAVATGHQDEPVKALKKSVDQLRAELDSVRSANAATIAQLSTRLDAKPTGPAVSDVVARLDKLDRDPRLADITSRLDRIEHQVSSPAPTGSTTVPQNKPPAAQGIVTQVGKTEASRFVKPAVLDNWIVRDVYSGIALVEGRSGSVREVVPGETLPGAGEVRSIERRGRGWIVVTSRGIIDTETW